MARQAVTTSEDDIVRRRAFLAGVLAGIAVPPGVLDSAARLDPVDGVGSVARQVAELEQAVHLRALEFPTVATVDQLPRLMCDYAGSARLAAEGPARLRARVDGALGQLCGFAGANLATWGDEDAAHDWYGRGLVHAARGGAREVTAWIAGRSTLLAVHRGDDRQVVTDAAYAVAISPRGQLGATLGNALAAGALARIGHPTAAREALDAARRAVDAQADVETFTGYSLPWYRLGRFASETLTALGDYDAARRYQDESLPAYPAGAATDPTMLRLDRAEGIARQGDPDAAAEYAAGVMLDLPLEHAAPILTARAGEVAELIGPGADPLRAALSRMRLD